MSKAVGRGLGNTWMYIVDGDRIVTAISGTPGQNKQDEAQQADG